METKRLRVYLNTASVLMLICLVVYACLAWLNLRAGHLSDRFYTNSFYLWAILEVITILVMTPFGWVLLTGSIAFAWLCARWIHESKEMNAARAVLRYMLAAALVGVIATLVDSDVEPKLSSWHLPLVGGVLVGLLTRWWQLRLESVGRLRDPAQDM